MPTDNPREFVFGRTRLRGIHASPTNPQRDGIYVRTIRRTGRMNPGVFVECTDGNGRFWEYPISFVEVING